MCGGSMTGLSWVAGRCPAKARVRLARVPRPARDPALSCGPAAGPRAALALTGVARCFPAGRKPFPALSPARLRCCAAAARGFNFRLEERE
jgi:hypothetical protein